MVENLENGIMYASISFLFFTQIKHVIYTVLQLTFFSDIIYAVEIVPY